MAAHFRMGPCSQGLNWLFSRLCPLCRQPLPPPGLVLRFCSRCTQELLLPSGGFSGCLPLPWWAAGPYVGAYRTTLLNLRRHPQPERVAALLRGMQPPEFPSGVSPLMVAVPSWKKQVNPLPPLICRQACRAWRWGRADLLERSRPVLGQHHLNQAMRLENQRDAFHCFRPARPREAREHPVLLVDDILTTGATALSAATALTAAGWRVHGVVCLARTLWNRKASSGDLGSTGRQGDRPG